MAKTMLPKINVVKELLSLQHIKKLCTHLWLVTKTLAAYQIGIAKGWKQLHTDETSCHQTSLVTVVMSFLMEDDKFKTVCLNGAIISEDGTAAAQS